jgi:predicted lysophospholipase L1 biosynthesis ABC-type transport system permease subunit
MEFKAATDRLMAAVKIPEIAAALGVTANAVARWRVDPSKEASREPSVPWRMAVAKLARRRGDDLHQLAADLERTEEGGG